MQKLVPDTNVWIAYFAGKEPAAEVMEKAVSRGAVVISVVTLAEFLVKAGGKIKKKFGQLVDEQGVAEVTREVAMEAAEMRRAALTKKKRVLLLDCFIAATAKVCRATLVTFDKRDFPFRGVKVKELTG